MSSKYIQYIIIGILCSLLWTGCTESERLGGEGTLRMKVSVEPYVKVVPTRALTSEEQAALEENCEIRLYSGKGLVQYYKGLAQMPEELQLVSGSYQVKVTAGDSVPASFDKSFYKGIAPFEITTGSVTNKEVKCHIANVLAAVQLSSNTDELFDSYKITISNQFGSLEFTKENIDAIGYYMLAEGESTINWQFDGVLKSGTAFETKKGVINASPATRYDLKLNFVTDGYEDGGAALKVTVDVTPLETIEDEVEFKQRPVFRGVGFDMASPYIYALNATNELSCKVAVTSALQDATISCSKFTEWGFGTNVIQLANVSEEDKVALEAKGIRMISAFDATTGAGILTVTLTPTLIQQMTVTETSYTFALSASDAENKSNTATLTVVVSDASVLTKDLVLYDVWTSKATLQGELIHETTDPLNFNYRIKGTANWTNVAAVRNSDNVTFAAELTGLQPGTEYEYQALSGTTPSAVICTFSTEAAVQLPNNSFEDWSGSLPLLIYANGESMFWDSGNHGSGSVSSALGGTNITEYDGSIFHSGKYSIRLKSKKVGISGIFTKFAAGNLFAGKYLKTDGTDGILGWGRDFNSRPKALHGYVRYVSGIVDNSSSQIASGAQDQGIIYIALGDWEKQKESETGEYWPVIIKTKDAAALFDSSESNTGIIAYGEQVYKSSTEASGLIEFTINLDYRSLQRKPSSIVVVASSSRYGDYFAGSTSSIMWLDDLELIYE